MSTQDYNDDGYETDDDRDGDTETSETVYGENDSDTKPNDDDSGTTASSSAHGYKFVIANGLVTGIFEVENGQVQQKDFEYGETWRVNGDQVIKTEIEHDFTQISTYADLNGDGVFTKISQTYTPVAAADTTTSDPAPLIEGGNDTDDQWTGSPDPDNYYGSVGNDLLHGDLGDDSLYGGNDDDDLYGDDGDDHLFGSNGDDHLYGGAGIDDASYEGDYAEYSLVSTATGLQLTDTNSLRDGIDVLESVERIHFKSVSLALDTDGVAGQAYRLYRAAFDRESDDEGLGYWMAQLENGSSLDSIASAFIASEEFQSLYGECTDEKFINLLYNNVLDRDADSGGYDYWLGQLGTNISREDVLVAFSESAENQNNVAELIAKGITYQEWAG